MRARVTISMMALGVVLFAMPAGATGVLLAQNWRDLTPKERSDAMQNYKQHQQLPQERKRDIEQQYERWRNMPPDQRDRVRQNYQRLQQLPPQERSRFEQKYEKWKQQTPPPPK